MEQYLLMLYVTLEQEIAIQSLFTSNRWHFRKCEDVSPDLLGLRKHSTKVESLFISKCDEIHDKKSSAVKTKGTGSGNSVNLNFDGKSDDNESTSNSIVSGGTEETCFNDKMEDTDDEMEDISGKTEYINDDQIEWKSNLSKINTTKSDILGTQLNQDIGEANEEVKFVIVKEEVTNMEDDRECGISTFQEGNVGLECDESKIDSDADMDSSNDARSDIIQDTGKVYENEQNRVSDNEDVNCKQKKGGSKSNVWLREKRRNRKLTIRKETRKGLFYCEECKYTFKALGYLEKHKKEGKCMFTCEFCGKVFNVRRYAVYKAHVRCHLNDRPYKCNSCDKTYTTERYLKDHERKHSNIRPYICQTCGLQFHISSLLIAHTKRAHYTGERETFPCEFCDITFKTRGHLKSHIIFMHTNNKPFTCEVCGKSFKIQGALKSHTLVHTENFPYLCDYESCGQKFKRKMSLDIHVRRTHANIKSHFCEHCGKGFCEAFDLKKHIRTHTGEKPFGCSLCDYRCALQGNLGKHMKTHNKHLDV